jgi:hypothetical protein
MLLYHQPVLISKRQCFWRFQSVLEARRRFGAFTSNRVNMQIQSLAVAWYAVVPRIGQT